MVSSTQKNGQIDLLLVQSFNKTDQKQSGPHLLVSGLLWPEGDLGVGVDLLDLHGAAAASQLLLLLLPPLLLLLLRRQWRRAVRGGRGNAAAAVAAVAAVAAAAVGVVDLKKNQNHPSKFLD